MKWRLSLSKMPFFALPFAAFWLVVCRLWVVVEFVKVFMVKSLSPYFFYLRWAEWCFFCCRGLLGLNVDVLRFFCVSKYTICCMFS